MARTNRKCAAWVIDLLDVGLAETIAATGLPAIEADTGMIEQVVMNLAVNARDAMPKGGCLEITTTLAEAMQLLKLA